MALIAPRLIERWFDRRRHPRYCQTPRCIRLAHHVGPHVDESGRSWRT